MPDPRGEGHRQLGKVASKAIFASVQGEEMLKSDC